MKILGSNLQNKLYFCNTLFYFWALNHFSRISYLQMKETKKKITPTIYYFQQGKTYKLIKLQYFLL